MHFQLIGALRVVSEGRAADGVVRDPVTIDITGHERGSVTARETHAKAQWLCVVHRHRGNWNVAVHDDFLDDWARHRNWDLARNWDNVVILDWNRHLNRHLHLARDRNLAYNRNRLWNVYRLMDLERLGNWHILVLINDLWNRHRALNGLDGHDFTVDRDVLLDRHVDDLRDWDLANLLDRLDLDLRDWDLTSHRHVLDLDPRDVLDDLLLVDHLNRYVDCADVGNLDLALNNLDLDAVDFTDDLLDLNLRDVANNLLLVDDLNRHVDNLDLGHLDKLLNGLDLDAWDLTDDLLHLNAGDVTLHHHRLSNCLDHRLSNCLDHRLLHHGKGVYRSEKTHRAADAVIRDPVTIDITNGHERGSVRKHEQSIRERRG